MKNILHMIAAMTVASSLLLSGCGAKAPAATPVTPETPVPGKAETLDWPKKDIQIVVPFAAGGDTDFNARVYAKYLTEELGVNVVVVNTTGNGGVTGTRKMMDSKADGYTVLFNTSALLMNIVSGAANYTMDDMEIASVAGIRAGDILTVGSKLGVKTMEELLAYTKAHPGEVRVAITTGAHNHATGLYLKNAGFDVTLLDAGGTSERMAALLGGHLEMIMNPLGGISDYLKSGELVALANPISERPKYIAEIPTAIEQGFDIANDGYYLWAFPKGTDPKVIEFFNKAVEKIATTNTEYQESIKTSYFQEPFYASREEAKKLLEAQFEDMNSLKTNFK